MNIYLKYTVALAGACSIALLSSCKQESTDTTTQPRSSETASTTVQADEESTTGAQTAETAPAPTVPPNYSGESAEIEVRTDDMLQLYAWAPTDSQLAVAVQLNRLNGTEKLTTQTAGTVRVAGKAAPAELTLSEDNKFLYADLEEKLSFPAQVTLSLDVGGAAAHKADQEFVIKGTTENPPLKE